MIVPVRTPSHPARGRKLVIQAPSVVFRLRKNPHSPREGTETLLWTGRTFGNTQLAPPITSRGDGNVNLATSSLLSLIRKTLGYLARVRKPSKGMRSTISKTSLL